MHQTFSQLPVSNPGGALLLVEGAGSEHLGRVLRHDRASAVEHHHRGQDPAAPGQADERKGPESQDDERDPAGHQGWFQDSLTGHVRHAAMLLDQL